MGTMLASVSRFSQSFSVVQRLAAIPAWAHQTGKLAADSGPDKA